MACPAQVPTAWLATDRQSAVHAGGPSSQLQASFLSSLRHSTHTGAPPPPLLLVLAASGRPNTCNKQQQPSSAFPWTLPFASVTTGTLASVTASITGAFLASVTGGDSPPWRSRAAGREPREIRDRGERPRRTRPQALPEAEMQQPLPAEGGGVGLEEPQSQTEEDSQDSEVLMPRGSRLNKRDITVYCSTCHHNTLFDEPEDLIECSCCHRVYHMACYDRHVSRTEGITPPTGDEEEGTPWFHSNACRKVHDHIRKETAAGERPITTDTPATNRGSGLFGWLPFQQQAAAQPQQTVTSQLKEGEAFHTLQSLEPPEASWRLMRCGAQTSPASRVAMSHVYNLLSRDFGYTLGDYSSFDIAALLRRHGKPVCAAIVDVYGPDVAEVFVMATHRDLRRQGNCRLLMQQLARSLHAAGVRRMVVSMDDTDDNARTVWDKLGFQPLEPTTLRQLSWSLPAFSSQATEGTLYLGQELKPKKGLLA